MPAYGTPYVISPQLVAYGLMPREYFLQPDGNEPIKS